MVHPSSPKLRTLVIMPALNEEASVGQVIAQLHRELPECDVLVIDDGSTDATAAMVKPPARVISLPFNLGIGGAMQTGYRYAAINGYDRAIQVDADGQHPPAQVRKIIAHLDATGADLVIGSRFLEPGKYQQTASRMFGIVMLRGLIRLLTGQRFTDVTSGFRVANRRVINAFAHWYPDDYPEPEVILLLQRAGFRLGECPVEMSQRTTGATSIPFMRGVFYVIKVSAALVLDTIRKPWPKAKVEGP